ncbi:hypothetical protein [Novosphingobium aquimarinum]|uniref:hypothetical protein n=1 Tax=Novosphingobium aquimarinum TaxID=2682494 RepID=UPI0018DDD6A5|nr:hypothetical protein [Novosphingobium aquimarinum]
MRQWSGFHAHLMGRTMGFLRADVEMPTELEKTVVASIREARRLANELSAKIPELERCGALLAAAHLQTCVDTLCKQFDIARITSTSD